MSNNSRLVIVSNRLHVTARAAEQGVQLTPSSGGLATGLQPYDEGAAGLWVGWPGDVSQLTGEQRAELDSQLRARGLDDTSRRIQSTSTLSSLPRITG